MKWTFRIHKTDNKFVLMLEDDHVTEDDHLLFYDDLRGNFGDIPSTIKVSGEFPMSHLIINGVDAMKWWQAHVAPHVIPPEFPSSPYATWTLITPKTGKVVLDRPSRRENWL